MIAIMAFVAAVAAPQAAPPSPLEVRFCPEHRVRPYPLDSLRGVQGLLLQNAAIVNRGPASVELDRISISLKNGETVIDERHLGPLQIAAAAKAGVAVKASGLMDLAAFQFCDGRLLGKAAPAAGERLAPGEALLLMQNVFAYKGTRTEIVVTAPGKSDWRP